MKKLFLILVMAAMTIEGYSTDIKGIQYDLNASGDKWIARDTFKTEEQEMVTYTLADQTETNWDELFTVQKVSGLKFSPKEFFNLFRDQLKSMTKGQDIQFKIIEEHPEQIFAEWWIKEKGPEDQHEWLEILKKGDDLFVVRYTSKKLDQIDAAQKKAEKLLKSVK